MTEIGHNNGPAMDAGVSYRKHVWTKARRDLLPVLPLPVVRRRVKRAKEIGLDYKVYATVHATTGRDVVALLFSSNALRLFQADQKLRQDRRERLAAVLGCDRRAMVVAPLRPEQVDEDELDAVCMAPHIHANWPDAAQAIKIARARHHPGGVLMIGDTSIERDWSLAGRLGGYLSAERFFT